MPFAPFRRWLRRNPSTPRCRRKWHWWPMGYMPGLERLEDRIVPSSILEVEPNDTLALASVLTLTQGPNGFLTGMGSGAIATNSDVDYWRFDAFKSDHVSIAGDGGQSGNSAYVELRNGSDSIIAQASDYNGGHALVSNFTIPADGTYYVKVRTYNGSGVTLSNYTMRVDLARGIDAEKEPDDTVGSASP